LRGSDLVCDPAATFSVKIKPDGKCDNFLLDFDGEIQLNGARVLIDDTALASAPQAAKTWTLATISGGGEFIGGLRGSNGYIVLQDGGKLVITRTPGTLFMVK
jgi:hypothetical protein